MGLVSVLTYIKYEISIIALMSTQTGMGQFVREFVGEAKTSDYLQGTFEVSYRY